MIVHVGEIIMFRVLKGKSGADNNLISEERVKFSENLMKIG